MSDGGKQQHGGVTAQAVSYSYVKLTVGTRCPRVAAMKPGQKDISDKTAFLDAFNAQTGERIAWLERHGDTLRVSNATRTVVLDVPWSNVDHAVREGK